MRSTFKKDIRKCWRVMISFVGFFILSSFFEVFGNASRTDALIVSAVAIILNFIAFKED